MNNRLKANFSINDTLLKSKIRFSVLMIALLVQISNAQIAFDENFENGRLDTSFINNNIYSLWPITNLHFRVTNALNTNPEFEIYDSVGYQLRSYHNMVYRYEGDSVWNLFDTAYKNQSLDYYRFKNNASFIEDTVYIAYWYPYTYSDLSTYMSRISNHSRILHAGVKGLSYQGRNLYGYQITDTNYSDCYKQNIVITARQHPIENINGYFVEGMTNYLLQSNDSIAHFLRRNFHFFIYPMINPDGVFNGSGQNALGQGLNREWADSLNIGGTPEIDTIRPVIWHETNQKVNWSIDIHANPGSNIPFYWFGYNSNSPVPQQQINKAGLYALSVYSRDSSSPTQTSSFQQVVTASGVNSSNTAANWFRRTFQAIAFTFEPTSEPMGPLGNNDYTINNYKIAGASLAKGFYDTWDTVQAFGGIIEVFNQILIAKVSGGHPPYSYNWTGPVNGVSDSLMANISGKYFLVVTDSLGCQWKTSIMHSVVGEFEVNQNDEFIVYPNPSGGEFIIEGLAKSSEYSINITTLEGRLLKNFQKSWEQDGLLHLFIDAEGLYVLEIISEDGIWRRKLIVTN